MKMIMLTVLFLLLSVNCFALEPSFLNRFNGTWFDDTGKVYMVIDNGSINGAKVVDTGTPIGSSAIGSANVRVLEKDGYRDIYFEWINTTVNPILRISNKIGLHKARDPRTFESVGGIYLGMPKSEVLKKYGRPDIINKDNPSIDRWLYANERWAVGITYDCVSEIVLLSDSKKRFDWSGYNCYNSAEDYKKKYNLNFRRLSTGETMVFGEPMSDYKQLEGVSFTMFYD